MSDAATPAPILNPANRIGLDYRRVPPRRASGKLIDIHSHVRMSASTDAFIEAATAYGVECIFTMSPLSDVDALRERYGDRLAFIAIPRWKEFKLNDAFRSQWLADLTAFRQRGARLCKFWMAPPMRERHGLTLQHAWMQPIIRATLDLGYHFMTHVGDPSVWWRDGGKYTDTAKFGLKADQYPQLSYLCQTVAPRTVIAAHMGGSVEDTDFLQTLLDRHSNLHLDTSATKWIVREVARCPDRVRTFMIRNTDRILFGSDIVVEDKYDFDHYASRYWAHHAMWETAYRGESPIDDPDAEQPPRLAGLDLPVEVLARIYRANSDRLFGPLSSSPVTTSRA